MKSNQIREVNTIILNNFGLNPIAWKILYASYINKVHPLPVRFFVQRKADPDAVFEVHRTQDCIAEVMISSPGYMGTRVGSSEALDSIGMSLFVRSYVDSHYPDPVAFTYLGVEVSIVTLGSRSEFNPLADFTRQSE